MNDDAKEMREYAQMADYKAGLRPDPAVYTDTCRNCGEPCRSKDIGQCSSCWILEHMT